MTDPFTETSKISYGKNFQNSIIGAIIGLILFILSFVILWLNEGRNVAQIAKANYINKTAIEIPSEQINRANDTKLVQLSGNAVTDSVLTDGIITLPNVFALSRTVEMYQWNEDVQTERKEEVGGSTTESKTYTYEKVWSEQAIDSKKFKKPGYSNPAFPVKSTDLYAETGKLGKFNLTKKQAKSMNDYYEYTDLPEKSEYKISEGAYYKGDDPLSPNIGDLRISYDYIPSGVDISVVGQQNSDDTISEYPYKDSSIYLQQNGIKTKTEMLTTFKKNNQLLTNLLRLAGWLVMFIGLSLLINPLVAIFKIIPFVEHIASFLTKGAVFLISLALSLLTIAAAWLAYRPFLSLALFLIIGGIIFAGVKYRSNKQI